MSFGQAFGAFAGGMSSGYTGGKSILEARQRKQEKEQQAPVQSPAPIRQSEADTAYEDQAWQMLRDMAGTQSQDESTDLSPYSPNQTQQSNGMSLNPSAMQKFMPSGGGATTMSGGSLSLGSGSAGLGGSGLIGSSSGAVSAGSTGGASFGLGGSLVGGTGTVGGSTFAAGAGGAGAGAGAGGGAGGGLAAGGPWAALAAVIGLNEENARKKGFRDDNRGKRLQDQITGKVLTQDIEGRYEPKLDQWTGGKASGWGFTGDMKGASQIGSFRFGKGLKTLWNDGTIGKIRKIF